MATAPQPVHLLRFGVFEMDLIAGDLRKNGIKVRLQEQPFIILTDLAMRPGEVVTREELYSKLPKHGTYDAKRGLNNAILKIREALDDSEESPCFIETIRNRGYRFLPPVEFIHKGSPSCVGSPYLNRESFRQEISRIGAELLDTLSDRGLTGLLHRLNAVIHQQPQHPDIYEAHILRSKIEDALDYSACSEQNRVRHRIRFETAAKVFEDPHALSLNGQGPAWYTMGTVRRQFGPFRQPVVLIVSHDATPQQDGHEDVRITSARKATHAERKAYAQASKKKR